MKKLLFCLLIASSIFIYKAKCELVNRDTFFENVVGFKEPEFQNKPGEIKATIELASTADSTKLRNPKNNKVFHAGKFKAINIGQLRTATQNKKASLPGSFNVIEALSPLGKSYYEYVDIGANQAKPENRDAVFQVASNFNALELTSRDDPMSLVTYYIYDKTQGPFASISAAPGTILRHYYMFYDPTTDPSTWQQHAILDRLWQKSDNKTQINLLENTDIPIVNSYVAFDEKSPEQVQNYKVEDIQVGWHEGIQVTSGLMAGNQHTLVDDPAQLINQVFTAAVDFGSNAAYRNNPIAIAIAQAIQDAAYEGTIRAAVAHDKKKVILTLIGGGVFANKLAWIANALEKMKDFIIASGIDVTLIIFDGKDYRLADQIDEFRTRMLKLVQETGGKYIQYNPTTPGGTNLAQLSEQPAQGQPGTVKTSIKRTTFFEYIMGVPEHDFQARDDLKKASIEWNKTNKFFALKNSSTKQKFDAGKFEPLSIGTLRNEKNKKVRSTPGNFNVIEALDPLGKSYYKFVDIRTLQADKQNQDAVFQVASSTNALELRSIDDSMATIAGYIYNSSQGAIAAVSAAPGLILRHYYMFYDPKTDPSTWRQQKLDKDWEKSDAKKQINLLENTGIPVLNGYIDLSGGRASDIKNYNIENIAIGWHERILVPFTLSQDVEQYNLVNNPRQVINQAFTAAIDFYSNSRSSNNPAAIKIAQTLQDAAYEGTIRAAVAHNKRKVFLTLLGSATFLNKLAWIASALEKMKDFIIASGIDVTLIIFDGNNTSLAGQIDEFRTRMLKLVQDTQGKYTQYSPTAPPEGKILTLPVEPSKPKEEDLPKRQKRLLEQEENRQKLFTKKLIINALYDLTQKLEKLKSELMK